MSARYVSVYGGGEIAYPIIIPANCTALIRLPDGQEQSVGAGRHSFREVHHES